MSAGEVEFVEFRIRRLGGKWEIPGGGGGRKIFEIFLM